MVKNNGFRMISIHALGSSSTCLVRVSNLKSWRKKNQKWFNKNPTFVDTCLFSME